MIKNNILLKAIGFVALSLVAFKGLSFETNVDSKVDGANLTIAQDGNDGGDLTVEGKLKIGSVDTDSTGIATSIDSTTTNDNKLPTVAAVKEYYKPIGIFETIESGSNNTVTFEGLSIYFDQTNKQFHFTYSSTTTISSVSASYATETMNNAVTHSNVPGPVWGDNTLDLEIGDMERAVFTTSDDKQYSFVGIMGSLENPSKHHVEIIRLKQWYSAWTVMVTFGLKKPLYQETFIVTIGNVKHLKPWNTQQFMRVSE